MTTASGNGGDDEHSTPEPIPEPPAHMPTSEIARAAWRVAYSAANAAASLEASVVRHFVAHEQKVISELEDIKTDWKRDFAQFRLTLVAAFKAVGIDIRMTPSGTLHAVRVGSEVSIPDMAPVVPGGRVASQHDIERGLAKVGEEMGDQIEQGIEELSEELRGEGKRPSDRIRELLAQERARVEAEQRIQELKLDAATRETRHQLELAAQAESRRQLEAVNARWWKMGFAVMSAIFTIAAGLIFWAITRTPPSIAAP